MTIHDIENKTVAELKAERAELVETAKSLPVEDLASRFVQARMDAKQRDELLGKQGTTITALQEGLSAATNQATALLERRQADHAATEAVMKQLEALKAAYNERTAELAEQTARAERLKAEAMRNHRALSQAARLLNEALAANAVGTADEGE